MQHYISSDRSYARGTLTVSSAPAYQPMSSTWRLRKLSLLYLASVVPQPLRLPCLPSSLLHSSLSFSHLFNAQFLGKSSLLSLLRLGLLRRPNISFKADGFAAA